MGLKSARLQIIIWLQKITNICLYVNRKFDLAVDFP